MQFSQQEEKRQKSERLQQQQKHENQMRDMSAQCESNMSELQQLQVPAVRCPPLSQFPPGQSVQGKDSTHRGGFSSDKRRVEGLQTHCAM